ncbi:MAG: DUF790 family protein [Oligoflexales bacterium]|nr:DUF790 family protein [Oligoflexales bacterium]
MLTKDLIKTRLRKGRVYPDKIDPKSLEAMELAADMLRYCSDAKGKTQRQLEISWEQAGLGQKQWYAPFKKLILDLASWQEPDVGLEDKRWSYFLEAQNLRTETLFDSFEAFQEAFSVRQNQDFSQISAELYGDLPDKRCIEFFPKTTANELIHRYNCAQIQGLILKARYLEITLENPSLEERRQFFRTLKFHQLVAEVLSSPEGFGKMGDLKVRLSGPLSVLQSPQTYGSRLANFFPRILLLDRWKCEAEIEVDPTVQTKNSFV